MTPGDTGSTAPAGSSPLPMGDGAPRLVATDLDGTILDSDGGLTARSRDAISDAEAAGVTVVFVTARPPRWLDHLADVVGPHGIALCANGAFVYDVPSRDVIENYCLDASVMAELVEDLRAAVPQIAFAVERVDGMGREETFVYRSEMPSEFETGSLDEITTSPVGKLLARCEDVEPQEFHDAVDEVVAGRAELAYSGAVGLAEITAKGVTKASGLARWCGDHGIDASEVWAFGDMPNDLPMLSWAGRAIAVRNAHPDVLLIADEVTESNDDDGVAAVLERIVAGGP